VIECYPDAFAVIGSDKYFVGHPCDWCVSIGRPDGQGGLEPIPLEGELMDEVRTLNHTTTKYHTSFVIAYLIVYTGSKFIRTCVIEKTFKASLSVVSISCKSQYSFIILCSCSPQCSTLLLLTLSVAVAARCIISNASMLYASVKVSLHRLVCLHIVTLSVQLHYHFMPV
jgi:hypothetical protein